MPGQAERRQEEQRGEAARSGAPDRSRRSSRLVPVECSTSPSTRNSDVLIGIWWIRKKIVAAIPAGPPMAMPNTM